MHECIARMECGSARVRPQRLMGTTVRPTPCPPDSEAANDLERCTQLPVTSLESDGKRCHNGFQCDDGQCIYVLLKCDGRRDCDDGSDEAPALCSAPSIDLSVGERRVALVQFESEMHEGLEFLLCAAAGSCGRLMVWGLNSTTGALAYTASSGCSVVHDYCRVRHHKSHPKGFRPFFSGEFVFLLERLTSGLSLWLRGHPDHRALLQAPATPGAPAGQLSVRPSWWRAPMAVRFREATDEDLRKIVRVVGNATTTSRPPNETKTKGHASRLVS